MNTNRTLEALTKNSFGRSLAPSSRPSTSAAPGVFAMQCSPNRSKCSECGLCECQSLHRARTVSQRAQSKSGERFAPYVDDHQLVGLLCPGPVDQLTKWSFGLCAHSTYVSKRYTHTRTRRTRRTRRTHAHAAHTDTGVMV
jgi:hypothetical protein